MSRIGYVLREEYLVLAIGKADSSRVPALEAIRLAVKDLDEQERSFSDRMAAARATSGIAPPELSPAARDASAASLDADREHHRLLQRRCRRAETAIDVVNQLLIPAAEDLEWAEFMLAEGEDAAVQRLQLQIVQKKRALVQLLRELLADES